MKKNDIILLLLCLLMGGVLWGGYKLVHREPGAYITIRVDGSVYKTLPLSRDTALDIPGADGGNNHLVIQDGKASISDADCPDKLCVHQTAISNDGESLVCLPHKLIVKVSSESQGDAPDVVAENALYTGW
jgi:hypothetical protein